MTGSIDDTPKPTSAIAVVVQRAVPPLLAIPHSNEPPAKRLMQHWLEGRDPATVAGYRGDMADLAEFMRDEDGEPIVQALEKRSPEEAAQAAEMAIAALIRLGNERGPGDANAFVLSYRANLIERQLAPRTINRRMSAIRSMLKLARLLGFITWTVEVGNAKTVSVKDTRGPGTEVVEAMMRALVQRARVGDMFALRNFAILRLLYDLGLRRGEVASLDLEHWYGDRRRLMVLGKKRVEREPIDDVPQGTSRAVDAWIESRGPAEGPLFISLDGRTRGRRLTGWSIWDMVTSLASSLDLIARPHGVRHTAITDVLDKSSGDVRAAQRFSRHARLETLQIYDDNRENLGGKLAAQIAAGMPGLDDEVIVDSVERCSRVDDKTELRCKRRAGHRGAHVYSLDSLLKGSQ